MIFFSKLHQQNIDHFPIKAERNRIANRVLLIQ